MSQRFEVQFENENCEGGIRVVAVELTPDEAKKAGGNELFLHAFVMRAAYQLVPAGYRHIKEAGERSAVRPIPLN